MLSSPLPTINALKQPTSDAWVEQAIANLDIRELHRIIDPIMRENNLSMHLTSCVQNLSLNSRRT